jgi:hypothetical protein
MMTSLQFIQLILDTYKNKPDTMDVIIGNSNSGLQFNSALRMPLRIVREIYVQEQARQKQDKWLDEKVTLPTQEVITPAEGGVIIRGKPLK